MVAMTTTALGPLDTTQQKDPSCVVYDNRFGVDSVLPTDLATTVGILGTIDRDFLLQLI
jgi:hypothetical protein